MPGVLRKTIGLAAAVTTAATLAAAAAAGVRSDVAKSAARTTAAGTARFALSVSAAFAGGVLRTRERGAVSFRRRQAHFYKLVPNEPVPEEQIVDGPLVYSNTNVIAALSDPTVKPWTKLDTRRLPKAKRAAGELDHVRALAYLVNGLVGARRVGQSGGALVHLRGRVDPHRVLDGVPAAQRSAIRSVLRTDYAQGPFPADFWLDRRGRVRRLLVSYSTSKGTRFTIDGTLSGFGTHVDVKPPPAREVAKLNS
jgi:hypothetical protein